MDTILHSLDPREDEEAEIEHLEDDGSRPVAMPGSGAPVLKIGEGCYLTLPILSD
jgi:hypothetical protein